jgi:riboflavin synthase
MFTGIIEHCGRITAVRHRGKARQVTIDLDALAVGSRVGDSIAVNGACLTLAALSDHSGTFDLSAETCRCTTLGSVRSGSLVNLERALVMGSRLGGHLVSGHVDGVGTLLARRKEALSECFTFALPADGSVRVIEKGSVTIDGVSLTTWDCLPGRCTVALIPHTLSQTTLGAMRVGATVNLEQDLVGRWVEELLRPLPKAVARKRRA